MSLAETRSEPRIGPARWDATTTDAEGCAIVRMRHLLRFLKGSSALYPELA